MTQISDSVRKEAEEIVAELIRRPFSFTTSEWKTRIQVELIAAALQFKEDRIAELELQNNKLARGVCVNCECSSGHLCLRCANAFKAKIDKLEGLLSNDTGEWKSAAFQKIKGLEAEITKLRSERCYICRPDDPLSNQEGCGDCDEKAALNNHILVLQGRLRDIIEVCDIPDPNVGLRNVPDPNATLKSVIKIAKDALNQ